MIVEQFQETNCIKINLEKGRIMICVKHENGQVDELILTENQRRLVDTVFAFGKQYGEAMLSNKLTDIMKDDRKMVNEVTTGEKIISKQQVMRN